MDIQKTGLQGGSSLQSQKSSTTETTKPLSPKKLEKIAQRSLSTVVPTTPQQSQVISAGRSNPSSCPLEEQVNKLKEKISLQDKKEAGKIFKAFAKEEQPAVLLLVARSHTTSDDTSLLDYIINEQNILLSCQSRDIKAPLPLLIQKKNSAAINIFLQHLIRKKFYQKFRMCFLSISIFKSILQLKILDTSKLLLNSMKTCMEYDLTTNHIMPMLKYPSSTKYFLEWLILQKDYQTLNSWLQHFIDIHDSTKQFITTDEQKDQQTKETSRNVFLTFFLNKKNFLSILESDNPDTIELLFESIKTYLNASSKEMLIEVINKTPFINFLLTYLTKTKNYEKLKDIFFQKKVLQSILLSEDTELAILLLQQIDAACSQYKCNETEATSLSKILNETLITAIKENNKAVISTFIQFFKRNRISMHPMHQLDDKPDLCSSSSPQETAKISYPFIDFQSATREAARQKNIEIFELLLPIGAPNTGTGSYYNRQVDRLLTVLVDAATATPSNNEILTQLITRKFYNLPITSSDWHLRLKEIIEAPSSTPEIIEKLLDQSDYYKDWIINFWANWLAAASQDPAKITTIIKNQNFKNFINNKNDQYPFLVNKIVKYPKVLKAIINDTDLARQFTADLIGMALQTPSEGYKYQKLTSELLTHSNLQSLFSQIPPSTLNQPLIDALWHNDKDIAKIIYDCKQFHSLSYSTVYKACLIAGDNGYWQIIKQILSSRKIWILFTLIPFLGVLTWGYGKVKNYFSKNHTLTA